MQLSCQEDLLLKIEDILGIGKSIDRSPGIILVMLNRITAPRRIREIDREVIPDAEIRGKYTQIDLVIILEVGMLEIFEKIMIDLVTTLEVGILEIFEKIVIDLVIFLETGKLIRLKSGVFPEEERIETLNSLVIFKGKTIDLANGEVFRATRIRDSAVILEIETIIICRTEIGMERIPTKILKIETDLQAETGE